MGHIPLSLLVLCTLSPAKGLGAATQLLESHCQNPGIIRVGKDLQSHQATLEAFDLNTKLNTDLV